MNELTVLPSQQQIVNVADKHRAYKTKWQRDQRREFQEQHGFSTAANYATGGLRLEVLKRDGYACVKCGMTDAEHKAKWARTITIDHRNKDRSENTLANLQTLCLSCHGEKDLIPVLRQPRFDRQAIRELRRAGKTFEQIALAIGCSIAVAWKYGKNA